MGASRIALGTAQFGMAYGLANRHGQVSHKEAAAILERAWAAGVDTIDTAISYGGSEQRLGEIGIRGWRVISKLPQLPAAQVNVSAWVQESVFDSLARLKLDRLAGLLLHRPSELLGPHGTALLEALSKLKEGRFVEKIGISVYDPAELDALWSQFAPDLMQAPLNILDRRFRTSGWLSRAQRAGTEVHTRSAFLQGVLLMSPTSRPEYFARWKDLWEHWERYLHENSLSPVHACIAFALSQEQVTRVVVGVDSLTQLDEILEFTARPMPGPPAALISEDPDLVNPSRWPAH